MTNDELLTGACRIPVFLLTGFLGSGKTSLLVRLLEEPAMARTAIVVNEFGDVGIDQLTLRRVDDQVRLLEHGCLCCTTREDLLATLRELYVGRLDGTLEPFDRIVIETTGLADPFPVVHTMLIDPLLQERFQYAGTITTIDVEQPAEEMSRRSESARQIAIADAFLITKTDRVEVETIEFVEALLRDANPDAAIASNDDAGVSALARRIAENRLVATQATAVVEGPPLDISRHRLPAATVDRLARIPGGGSLLADASGRYNRVGHTGSSVVSYVIRIDEPLEWSPFAQWLQRLLARNRDAVLRVKGVVQVCGQPEPILIQAVRHLFQPTVPLPRTAGDSTGGRIVVIVDNPTQQSRAEVGIRTLGEELFAASSSGVGTSPPVLDRALR